MAASDYVVRFATSSFGTALDVFAVRWTGHSVVSWLFSKTYGAPYNAPLLLLSTGRKTGRQRQAVLPFFPVSGEAIAIVGSRGGMPTDPQWVHNLRAQPQAEILIARRRRPVRARVVSGEERTALWREICERSPVYVAYQRRAKTREIPVVVLEPSSP